MAGEVVKKSACKKGKAADPDGLTTTSYQAFHLSLWKTYIIMKQVENQKTAAALPLALRETEQIFLLKPMKKLSMPSGKTSI